MVAGVKDFFSDHPQMVRNTLIEEKSKLVEYIFLKLHTLRKSPHVFCITSQQENGLMIEIV